MKKNILFLFLIFSSCAFAQETDKQAKWSVRESANNKSGNSQDVLTSFYQLAMKNLFGDSRTLEFQSSLFAIQAKADSSIWIDTAYLKRTFARNFVVGINMSVDSNFKFEKNTLQLKYAIINNRDKTVFDFAKTLGSLTQAINFAKRNALTKYVGLGKSLTEEQKDYFNSDKNVSYETLPKDFRELLEAEFVSNPILKDISPRDYMKIVHERYNIASNVVANKALWTIEAKFVSNAQNIFSSVNLNTEFLKGMVKKKTAMNLEVDAKAAYNFDNDTMFVQRNLNRQVASGEFGFNWIILKSAYKEKSLLEFKATGAFNYVVSGKFKNEDDYFFTANGTLRLRVSDNFWIPIEIKYDPKKNEVYGFLNVTSNFDWLNKIIGNKKT